MKTKQNIPTPDLNFDGSVMFTREVKSNVRHNIERLEYGNSFIPKPVLRPEYGTLFEHQGFHMPGLHRMYLSVMLDFLKQTNLLLDMLPHQIGTVWDKSK